MGSVEMPQVVRAGPSLDTEQRAYLQARLVVFYRIVFLASAATSPTS
jgi:hypothetical protein